MEPVVTGRYWVVRGRTGRKKEQVEMGSLGQSGLTWAILKGLTLPKCVFHVCIFAWPGFTHNVVSLEMHMCLWQSDHPGATLRGWKDAKIQVPTPQPTFQNHRVWARQSLGPAVDSVAWCHGGTRPASECRPDCETTGTCIAETQSYAQLISSQFKCGCNTSRHHTFEVQVLHILKLKNVKTTSFFKANECKWSK